MAISGSYCYPIIIPSAIFGILYARLVEQLSKMSDYSVTRYAKDLPRNFGFIFVDVLDATDEILCARIIVSDERLLKSRDLDLTEDLDLITDVLSNGVKCAGVSHFPSPNAKRREDDLPSPV